MKYYDFYTLVGKQTHTMIGGATNSGKSVVESGIIYNLAVDYTPDEVEFWFIDPKKTELVKYEWLPHVTHYADNMEDAMLLLDLLLHEMNSRNTEVQQMIRDGRRDIDIYPGRAIYCFIDETAQVIGMQGKEVLKKFQLIVQMARSAGIHMVFCSQNFDAKMMPSHVAGNITCTVGLYVPKNKVHISRTLIGNSDCCKLPKHGKCVLVTPDDYDVVDVPMYTKDDWNELRKSTLLRRVI